jgi:Phage tail protein
VALSPPQPAQAGQQYLLSLAFFNYGSGSPADPSAVQLDITEGGEAPLTPDAAGPFFYAGASSASTNTIWRTGTGTYSFLWAVPSTQGAGTYVANWTCTYGSGGDEFLILESFQLQSAAIVTVSKDVGYWTGSLAYQPAWSTTPFSIPLGSTDSSGITWTLLQVTGWDSPPSAVGQVIQRSADHGGYPTAAYYGPRIVTLTVLASAPSQALRDVARAQMQQAVPVSDLGTFTYVEPVPKLAQVRRVAGADVTESYPTLADVVFTIPLVAPDPRKYAVTAQSASSVSTAIASPVSLPFSSGTPVTFPAGIPSGTTGILAVNSGTFETRPVITVTGPVKAPAIINSSTGQTVSYSSLTLKATDTLVLNMDARQGYLNGTFTPADVSSAWWVLQPGTTLITLGGTNKKSSIISAAWSSAFI